MTHSICLLSKRLARSEKYEGNDILHHLPTSVANGNDIYNLVLL